MIIIHDKMLLFMLIFLYFFWMKILLFQNTYSAVKLMIKMLLVAVRDLSQINTYFFTIISLSKVFLFLFFCSFVQITANHIRIFFLIIIFIDVMIARIIALVTAFFSDFPFSISISDFCHSCYFFFFNENI